MSEKRPKISQEQPKGKLTPEEIKEMVKKYKKEHEGLLPEYFSLPGEEKEEEREHPEELLDYYQLKEKLKPIEQGLENKTLRENVIKLILSYIQEGQKEGITKAAWDAFHGYSFLLSYPEFNEIKKTYPNEINQIEQGLKNETLRKNAIKEILSDIQEGQKEGYTGFAWAAFLGYFSFLSYPEFNEIKKTYPNEINQIEQGLKNETLRKNAIKEILSDIQKGQKEGNNIFAWWAFDGYSFLLSYLSHLYKIGQKKLAEIESQKAMHPEKKLPPMPEEKAF